MRARSILLLLSFLALLLLTTTPALASNTFSVSGNVTDKDAIPLPYASVELQDWAYNRIASTHADANGHFSFGHVSSDSPWIMAVVTFPRPPYGNWTLTTQSGWHGTNVSQVTIPDTETRFNNYILPGKGYIYGHILRASDGKPVTGTVYLSNGKTREVTDPAQGYLFEVGPGDYVVYAVHFEGEKNLTSEKVEIQALPAESKEEVPPVDLRVGPEFEWHFEALALVVVLGLIGVLALYYILKTL